MLAVVTGGGTGGHFIPAMAIVNSLRRAGFDVAYIGSRHGIEARLAGSGTVSYLFNLRGVKGKGVAKAAAGAVLIVAAFVKITALFLKLKPAVVIGTGGFVSIPAVAAGFLCRAKVYLQEQNAIPGAATKALAPLATRIFLGFEKAKNYFPGGKALVSGNPLRDDFVAGGRDYKVFKTGDKMRILVLGGSQGAGFINGLVTGSLGRLRKDVLEIFHQAGEKDRNAVEGAYRDAGFTAEVFGFVNDIHRYYRSAHLVVARAGAMTVSEIIGTMRPSILVPFPYAIYDHQAVNASALAEAGAALMYRENQITPDDFAALVNRLYENPAELEKMASNLAKIECGDAAAFIADNIRKDCHV